MGKNKGFLLAAAVMAAVFAFAGCGGTESDASDKSVADTGSVSDTTDISNTTDVSDTESGDTADTSEEENIVLTEETDFASLVSEKVTEEGWKAAFDKAAYTDYTIKNMRKSGGAGYYKNDNGTVMVSAEGYVYYYSLVDEVLTMYIESSGEGEVMTLQRGDEGYEEMIKMYNEWVNVYSCSCPDFGEFYSSFAYDDAAGQYVYTGEGINAERVFEVGKTDYLHAEVKIVNDKIAYVRGCFGLNEDGTYLNDYKIYFYDFGTTEVTMPEVGEEE